jgi:hypothetical protein
MGQLYEPQSVTNLLCELGLRKAVLDRRFADPLPSTPRKMQSIEQGELKLFSLVHGVEPASQQELLVVAFEVLNDPLIHWLKKKILQVETLNNEPT